MTLQHEALRQQMLLRALWRDGSASALQGWLRTPTRAGLPAYRANAGALAERALAGAFPTVAALVGDETFAALARDFWRRHPPLRGDIGQWGAALPAFIATKAPLATEPYLADSARLDWLVHEATRAADAPDEALALERLASIDPAHLRVALAPGAALLASRWPVAAIWQAHQQREGDRFAPVRAAFVAQQGDQAFIWRDGFRVRVERVDDAEHAFLRALLGQRSLAQALDLSGPGFTFDQCLARALSSRWIADIRVETS